MVEDNLAFKVVLYVCTCIHWQKNTKCFKCIAVDNQSILNLQLHYTSKKLEYNPTYLFGYLCPKVVLKLLYDLCNTQVLWRCYCTSIRTYWVDLFEFNEIVQQSINNIWQMAWTILIWIVWGDQRNAHTDSLVQHFLELEQILDYNSCTMLKKKCNFEWRISTAWVI